MVADRSDEIQVVAGVLSNQAGEVLLTQRSRHVHKGGYWEFPGGKVDNGESELHALHRELREEIGIEVGQARPMIVVHYRYPHRNIRLAVWRILEYAGVPYGREAQPLLWCTPSQLWHRQLPEANMAVVNALRLPDVYLITPQPGNDVKQFLDNLYRSLCGGIRLVQLRAKSTRPAEYHTLAREAVRLCHNNGAAILLNAPPGLVTELGADGIHLTGEALADLKQRPLAIGQWVAASCHNSQEIERAQQIGCDFIVVSPVERTLTHRGLAPLGWKRFAELAACADIPVYALGGLTASHVPLAHKYGGQGIAAIRGLWQGATAQ